ncbi:uncharacterized protein LOC121806959 isoform X2 [Salvia splendens]|uniref:uncharacterized protein LOC121806959 isoform X2 n=1 Tax=Salvia splendens TaxID=180675 RepID=UPI001C2597D6|nr:uncharacterized protein LOC121806959 isoform X2 [Salvia splendens]
MADVTRSANFSVDVVLRGNLEVNLVAEDFNTPCVVQHGTNVRWHTDNGPKDDGVKNTNVVAEIQSVIDAYKEIDMDDDDFMDSGPVGKPVGTEVVVYNANKGRMEVRTRTEKTVSHALRSPFADRPVKITNKLSKDEKESYYWILVTHERDGLVLVYDDDVVKVTKMEMCSLIPRQLIVVGVIDARASYLNNMEEFRSSYSARRLFFTTYPCLYTIVTKPQSMDVNTIIANFCNNLNRELKEIPYFKWEDVNTVLFPICANQHYYAVCFCFKRNAIAVIDNSANGDDNDLTINYGHIPETLRSYFCHFLIKNGLHAYCKIVSNSKMQRLKMPWRTVDNVEDCGVFLMRHMETYKGEREGCWNCGLKKYCSALMLAENSHESFNNKIVTATYYEEESKHIEIDVEKMIAPYLKKK